MSQNERVKIIRKSLNLTMEKFGERLGVGKTAISGIETGRRNLTEQMTKAICREFNVNEDWLRTGAGGDENMFIPDDARKYLDIGKAARTPNEFRNFLVQVMSTLPDEYCDFLYAEFKRFSEHYEQEKRND